MYRYAYYCSRCHDVDEYTTLPVESPECIVDHVETHDSGMISLWRDRDDRVVSDHYETGGDCSRIDQPRPWAARNSAYSFVRNIFPDNATAVEADGKQYLVCKFAHNGCIFRKEAALGLQDPRTRKTFYNSLRRHEAKCSHAPKPDPGPESEIEEEREQGSDDE